MSHIQQEIASQPDTLRRLFSEGSETAQRIVEAIRQFDPAFVMIAARGTSDHAARYMQYLLGIHAGLPVALSAPSIHTLYHTAPRMGRAVVIGISQSGQAEDVRQVIADANTQGALTISITNNAASPLANEARYHLPIMAGEEISVAATKTYTAELGAVAMLTAYLVGKSELTDSLAKVPDWVTQTLQTSEAVQGWVERYRYMGRFAAIGRSYNMCTAFEVSLKIKELCYITGVEYSEAEFRHGPIALLQAGLPVIVVAPEGNTLDGMLDLLEKLRTKDSECLVISNNEKALSYAQKPMPIPTGIPEWISPLVAVLPGQLFAMYLAVAKGNPVDKPIGLTKVTITH
jgi:glutamine---fructose-6-phosphate transaminase (isomerizing)